MLISVITPTKNNCRFLRNCIESVKNQRGAVEHIIIDGGSTDDTLSLLEEYDHIRWISEPDGGMYDAINKGLKMAKGEVVGYLNADDRFCPNTVSDVLGTFESDSSIDFVYGACTYMDQEEKELVTFKPLPYLPKLLKNMNEICWSQPGCFWRARIHDSIGFFDTSLKYCGDYDFFLRLMLNGLRAVRINAVLSLFMIHGNSLSAMYKERMEEEYRRIDENHEVRRNSLIGALGQLYFKLINAPSYFRGGYMRSRLYGSLSKKRI